MHPRVLLINPPQSYFKASRDFDVAFPLGLLSVAASIKNICTLEIFDCLVEDFEINTDENSVIYGTSYSNIHRSIKEFAPDIVGITIPFYSQTNNAVVISKICKKINSDMVVVFGGPETTVKYDLFLKEKLCDYCVVGEGEKTFYEFLEKYQNRQDLLNVNGLAQLENDEIIFSPRDFIMQLDDIPLPAYDLIDMNKYLGHSYLYRSRSIIHNNSISMITSRGCPYKCTFCSIKLHMGKRYRYHSVAYIIKHIRHCIDNYGITNFHMEDDNLSLRKDRFEKLLDEIIDRKLNIKWDAGNGLRIDSLNYNLLEKMKRSGCVDFKIAIESGNQHVLDNIINKNSSLSYVMKIVKHIKQLKMRADAFYVIGFPGETKENIKDTLSMALNLLRKYDIVPFLNYAVPLYATDLYETCVREGYIKENLTSAELTASQTMVGEPCFATKCFTKDELKSLVNDYRKNLTLELMRFSIRNPLRALGRIKQKPSLLKRYIFFK